MERSKQSGKSTQKLTIKRQERRQWRHSDVFIVTHFSSVNIVDFEQKNASWVAILIYLSVNFSCVHSQNERTHVVFSLKQESLLNPIEITSQHSLAMTFL